MKAILLFPCLFIQLGIIAQTDTTFTLYFGTDVHELTEESRMELSTQLVGLAKDFEVLSASINAYCDDVGSKKYNLELSLKRAFAVHSLATEILRVDKVASAGKGELPLDKSNVVKPLQRQEHRKAELVVSIIPKLKEPVPKKEVEPKNVRIEEAPTYLGEDLMVGDKIVLDGILFVGNKDVILAESFDNRKALLDQLKAYPNVSVQIQGHIYDPCYYSSDCISPFTNNLSERRARSIYTYLVTSGIDKSRLSYIGFEGKYPLNGDPKNDRRVEIEITSLEK
ncbi:MAG: OmpA family protein [Flavobacteriales bacterium]